MKTFFVFAGQSYYPRGGMNDFKGSFLTREEADAFAIEINIDKEGFGKPFDWINITDISDLLKDY